MPRSTSESSGQQRLLWEPSMSWQQLPDDIQQHALDVLSALYLETVLEHNLEITTDDDDDASDC